MISLPIDVVLPEVLKALKQGNAAVLEAPPGAGKTTRVPSALFDAGLAGQKEIVVLQPRRLATRLAAARVAEERGEALGRTVGYQVRFDDVSSAATRIRFITEGLLTRKLIGDPTLANVGAVVLDEFHERHLAADLGLAMVRQLQKTRRPDLKLLVMSATLDAAPIAQWLEGAPAIRSEGRRFEVRIEHQDVPDERPLEQQVLAALKRLVQQQALDGHVLVFLPGAAEIRRAREACDEFAQRHGLEVHVLHGDLTAEEQDRAVGRGAKKKLILSTNVAETSVTIDGIAAVIDSGLARVASHSPWSGMPTLGLSKVSKSSAIQRAGRAGRTREGVCLRLYSRFDFEGRPMSDAPEIRRLDFSEAALSLRAMGVTQVAGFNFFEAPPAASLQAAETLLTNLGAIDGSGALTAVGRQMLTFAVHPRLARLVVEGDRLGVAEQAAICAALLQEKDIRLEARSRFGDGHKRVDRLSGRSDLLDLLDRFQEGKATSARSAGLDSAAFSTVDRTRKQLLQGTSRKASAQGEHAIEDAVLRCVLSAYPDRVARRRKARAPEVVLSSGGSATLDANSVVHDAEFMVAVDAEERKGAITVRLASAIESDWLLELPGALLSDADTLQWNADQRRVERVTRTSWGAIAIEESRRPAEASAEASQVLLKAVFDAGIEVLIDPAVLSAFTCRVEALKNAFPDAGFPLIDTAFLRRTVETLCEGVTSVAALKEMPLLDALKGALSSQQNRLLMTEAPERITLPSGRSVQIHYEPARPPWIESRLQDFFGLLKGPSIGKTPLVLHLLAPNHNAVQVTTDLSGFWERHYPAVRKELMRQYPRHSWPEDPKTATPPPPRPPRPPRR